MTDSSRDQDQSLAQSGGGVRRHHTITAASRSARSGVTEEQDPASQQQHWNNDEVVDQDWVGGVGAVGEKSGLHRQASLPTRYHRSFQAQGNSSGTITPKKTLNSLSAIAGHEGDEEDWERDISSYREDDQHAASTNEHQLMEQASQSPLSPHFTAHAPSPPPASSGVRRHQSLTYGTGGHGARHQVSSTGLRRSGTLQAQVKHSTVPQPGPQSPSPTNAEEDYPDETPYEDEYYNPASPRTPQPQYPTSPMGRSSPWGSQGGDWRGGGGYSGNNGGNNAALDEVQRALSSLEINSGVYPANAYGQGNQNNSFGSSSRKLQLVTDFNGRQTPGTQNGSGPVTASGYPQSQHQRAHTHTQGMSERDERAQTVTGSAWEQKDRVLGGRSSNPNLNYAYQQVGRSDIPSVPPIPPQYLQQQSNVQAPRLGASNSTVQNANGAQNFIGTPVDVPTLIATKGYNPVNFDIHPQFARYFVIKSYTEDDVHKSLKYEIWSSTDPGNKRLDKAFKETAGRGPIYLFFSVNASGHFCGMAEMLTPVDYTRSSTVWASDKWKGVFKVRWVFVRDIPNANLRHIRLNNTQERKPVTNSRDTQELLPDAGQEMLRIFHSHPARTSLLQDFAFYELQSMQKMQQQQQGGAVSPTLSPQMPSQAHSPVGSPQQTPFALGMNAYGMPQMSPMMQMQMQMNMGSQFAMPQSQAMHQSVLRNPSPGPQNQNGQNYMGMPGF